MEPGGGKPHPDTLMMDVLQWIAYVALIFSGACLITMGFEDYRAYKKRIARSRVNRRLNQ